MLESLILFESVINSRWFVRTSIILFLNKVDLFRMKLPKIPLDRYFPDYGGGPDVNKAAKYILWRFNQTNRAKLNVYPHLTQATDTSNVIIWPYARQYWCSFLPGVRSSERDNIAKCIEGFRYPVEVYRVAFELFSKRCRQYRSGTVDCLGRVSTRRGIG
ncbi:G-protein alpha subunit-domain-containing protein [Jimgerdemannia flammicorona]|uniref:G-protein alpha subunit-domain-containing protein n=1 Tax=Jimgerdemannia flammicorona TaxID=994334 RepID=A0A433BAM9_9FUNG|nr:G-protein alpha subunit-domain-containing protein [Jimgerdemannia flammicorona]